ncbi:hypothetical protein BO70DRAFT_432175 [Aspergillus heteromorphus CBS 117.55]|uniref:Uncharacterized protein n=1 Tax=Aspergillus heteromorphus CBS 117.55 TaxID=1448321 RepID=A0A317V7X6_9EURO|nr:uncharacterized protein BO70DRAFT_432175 [Aspergillus heteromorphus CBS 117.55]PWY70473.1 hypothetical protein BO70DRAFT_432175 [Aspergillus heteromorphus CBS 117.55]
MNLDFSTVTYRLEWNPIIKKLAHNRHRCAFKEHEKDFPVDAQRLNIPDRIFNWVDDAFKELIRQCVMKAEVALFAERAFQEQLAGRFDGICSTEVSQQLKDNHKRTTAVMQGFSQQVASLNPRLFAYSPSRRAFEVWATGVNTSHRAFQQSFEDYLLSKAAVEQYMTTAPPDTYREALLAWWNDVFNVEMTRWERPNSGFNQWPLSYEDIIEEICVRVPAVFVQSETAVQGFLRVAYGEDPL